MYLGKDDLPRIVRIVMVALGPIDGSATISALNYYRFCGGPEIEEIISHVPNRLTEELEMRRCR
jgi:hypothetical protein